MGKKDAPLREEQHRARAARHCRVGDALADAGDEWAAVLWFYSGYHLVKAALLRDPIWADVRALQAISVDLIPEDRFTGRHKGRKRASGQPREWGLNELVLKLYRPAAGAYDRLHQASIDVRYSTGLPDGALGPLRQALQKLQDLDAAGELEAPILWPRPD